MPATDESTLALAAQLRALGDPELSALLVARDVRGSSIKDFFDLADALLDPDSVQLALGRLDRSALITVAALGTSPVPLTAQDAAAHVAEWGTDPAAAARHLTAAAEFAIVTHADGRYAVPPSVSRQLEEWPALGLPSLDELASTPPPAALVPVSQTEVRITDAGSAEHAFATSTSIAELIAELQHESARELARGGVALPDSKRLAASMSVDIERVPELLEIASRAGLVALDSGRWLPTAASASWLSGTSGERWARLAAAWLERLPRDIREILGHRAHAVWGEQLQRYVDWLFPAGRRADARTRADLHPRRAAAGHHLRPRSEHARGRADHAGAGSRRRGDGRPVPRRGDAGLRAARPVDRLPRSPRPAHRRAAAHHRRRGGPRPRLQLPGVDREHLPRHGGRRDGDHDQAVPVRNLADGHPAATRIPHRRGGIPLRSGARRRRRRRPGFGAVNG